MPVNWTKLLIWLAIIIFVIPAVIVIIPFIGVLIGVLILWSHMF